MTDQDVQKPADEGISKVKLAIGAASLFLFIIGVKRTFRSDHAEKSQEAAGAENARSAGTRKKK